MNTSRHDLSFINSSFAKIDDQEIHYRLWGADDEQAEKILLIHGFGASTFSWRFTAPYLEEHGYTVIASDLPGFGLSERKAGLDHTSEARAELMWELLDKICPESKWHLVGHSMGGAVVTAMALQEPDRVESLTLVAGAVFGAENKFIQTLFRYPPSGRWVKVLATHMILRENRIKELLASAYGREPVSDEVEGYFQPVTVEKSEEVFADLMKTGITSMADRVEEVELPVLLVWGEEDAWVPLEQGRKLVDKFPRADLVIIPEEGHVPMETSPVIFNEILLIFISEVTDRD
ncbi:MAG: alpha/beta hydrolase [Bacillota bacterium]|nr:alpha/beta hydrolase [Bacillota bacterium]